VGEITIRQRPPRGILGKIVIRQPHGCIGPLKPVQDSSSVPDSLFHNLPSINQCSLVLAEVHLQSDAVSSTAVSTKNCCATAGWSIMAFR